MCNDCREQIARIPRRNRVTPKGYPLRHIVNHADFVRFAELATRAGMLGGLIDEWLDGPNLEERLGQGERVEDIIAAIVAQEERKRLEATG